eukprot:COSAG05_NODE_1276_length_5305_cov_7.675759_5_plen_67_part_00
MCPCSHACNARALPCREGWRRGAADLVEFCRAEASVLALAAVLGVARSAELIKIKGETQFSMGRRA